MKNRKGVDENFSVSSLTRGMAVMELLAKNTDGLGLVEIAGALKIPNNAVFRIASALVELGYLHRDDKSRKFRLGGKLLSLGLATVHEKNIVERSNDLMRQFRDEVKEMVALGSILKEEAQGVVLSEFECSYLYGYRLQAGHRWPLYCTGPGKAILAFLPSQEYRELLERMTLKRFTPDTITDRRKLDREMALIRRVGYAVDRGEVLAGCHCVSAPVFDAAKYPVAAIWASGPSERMTASKFPEIGKTVIRYAELISMRLQLP